MTTMTIWTYHEDAYDGDVCGPSGEGAASHHHRCCESRRCDTEDAATADALFVLTTKSGTERKRKNEERICYELIGKWRLSSYVIDPDSVAPEAAAVVKATAFGAATASEVLAPSSSFTVIASSTAAVAPGTNSGGSVEVAVAAA